MGRPTLSLASTSAASRSVSRIGASPWAALSMTPSARPKNKQKVIISMHLDRFSIIMLHSLSHKTSFSLAISPFSLSLTHRSSSEDTTDTERHSTACLCVYQPPPRSPRASCAPLAPTRPPQWLPRCGASQRSCPRHALCAFSARAFSIFAGWPAVA